MASIKCEVRLLACQEVESQRDPPFFNDFKDILNFKGWAAISGMSNHARAGSSGPFNPRCIPRVITKPFRKSVFARFDNKTGTPMNLGDQRGMLVFSALSNALADVAFIWQPEEKGLVSYIGFLHNNIDRVYYITVSS